MSSSVRSILQPEYEAGRFSAAAWVAGNGTREDFGFCGDAGPCSAFDVASLTKVLCTTPLVVESGLDIRAAIEKFFPWRKGAGVTIEHLLTHCSGLAPYDMELALSGSSADVVLNSVLNHKIGPAPSESAYSCLGFITLAEILRLANGLDSLRDLLGLLRLPDAGGIRYVPTVGVTPGVVHDPLARALGGFGGNAGLFATIGQVSALAKRWLPGGEWFEKAGPDWIRPREWSGTRALGWDTKSPQASTVGERFGPRTYGHTGFTGCSLWIDPDQGLYVCLLTNAVMHEGHLEWQASIRPRVHDTLVIDF